MITRSIYISVQAQMEQFFGLRQSPDGAMVLLSYHTNIQVFIDQLNTWMKLRSVVYSCAVVCVVSDQCKYRGSRTRVTVQLLMTCGQ